MFPNQDSVDGSALAVWVRRSTYAPVIVIWKSVSAHVKQSDRHSSQKKWDKLMSVPYVSLCPGRSIRLRGPR